jgi:hypothetical protein
MRRFVEDENDFRRFRAACGVGERLKDPTALRALASIASSAQTPLERREDLIARFTADCGAQNDELMLGVLITALGDPMWQIRYVAGGSLKFSTRHEESGYHYRAAKNDDGIRVWKKWLLEDHRRDWRDGGSTLFDIGASLCTAKGTCSDERGCTLTNLYDDFPAAKAGLKQGDVVDAVDGDSVAGKRCTDVAAYEILGYSKAPVVLGVRRADGSHVELSVPRQALVWQTGGASGPLHGKPTAPIGGSHTFVRTPLRQLFDRADFVADVFPKKLEQGNGEVGNASLFASRIFKGDQHQRTLDYSWDTFWAPRPFMLGQRYIALLRHGEAVTEDESFLNEESISVDPVKGVTDHCRPMTGTDTVSCRVFKVYGRGQQGVLFDSSMVHHLTMHVPEVVPHVTGMIEVVLVEDVEHAFCEWGGTCINDSSR